MPDRKIVPWYRHIPMDAGLSLPSTSSHLFCLNDGQRYIVRRLLELAHREEYYASEWWPDGTYSTPSAAWLDAIFAQVDGLEDELMSTLTYETGGQIVALLATTSGTITLRQAFQTLAYTKIGRVVALTGVLQVESVSSPVGILRLSGLPFPAAAGYENYSGFGIYAGGLAAQAETSLIGAVLGGTQVADFYRYYAGNITNIAEDVLVNSTFVLGITYFAAS
jgi:hypothetical protein